MNRINRALALCVSAIAFVGVAGCKPTPISDPPTSPQTQILAATHEIAANTLGLKLDNVLESDQKDNFAGLRTENITFSRRLDSRTFFAYDRRFSDTIKTGFYKDSNAALEKRARELLERLKIPAAEVAAVKIVQETMQVGERDVETGKMKLEPQQVGKKWARVTRQIDGIPVFSSRASVALMPNGEVGFLEAHWPVISAEAIDTAHRYEQLIGRNWQAPEQRGARVESVTAGILHSPAVGTVMDIVPVIRVVYATLDEHLGKKPVLYVDGDGKPIAMPRTLLAPPREALQTTRAAPNR